MKPEYEKAQNGFLECFHNFDITLRGYIVVSRCYGTNRYIAEEDIWKVSYFDINDILLVSVFLRKISFLLQVVGVDEYFNKNFSAEMDVNAVIKTHLTFFITDDEYIKQSDKIILEYSEENFALSRLPKEGNVGEKRNSLGIEYLYTGEAWVEINAAGMEKVEENIRYGKFV